VGLKLDIFSLAHFFVHGKALSFDEEEGQMPLRTAAAGGGENGRAVGGRE